MRLIEAMLRRAETAPWEPVYRMVIGFLLTPAFGWSRGGASGWSLIPFTLSVLAALRIGPAIARKLLPFSADIQAHWFARRKLAKRYDSYQWRKLLWFGFGAGLYLFASGTQSASAVMVTCACVLAGGAGELVWRRICSTKQAVIRSLIEVTL